MWHEWGRGEGLWRESLKERGHLGDLRIDGRIILKFKK
jgi:hypothetical protein